MMENLQTDLCKKYDLLSANLKYLMTKNSLDAGALGQKIGVAASTINSIRRGGGNPTLATIAAMSQHFNLSISELTESRINEQLPTKQFAHRIPLITMKEISTYLKNPIGNRDFMLAELSDCDAEDYFAVSINNNSLYPLFEKGTLFLIRRTQHVTDGDIVLVDFGNASYCFRRIFIESKNYFFKPLADNVQPTGSNSNEFSIIGVVTKAIQNFQ